VGGDGGERLDEEALHVRAHVGLLPELAHLFAQVLHVPLVVALERAELRLHVLVLGGLDRLLVGLDGVHVEMDEILHCADGGHRVLLSPVHAKVHRPRGPASVVLRMGSPLSRRRSLRPRPERRSRAPGPLLVIGVAGRLLLALAQLGQVDVADVAEPRSARPVLAPIDAAPHVELLPAALPQPPWGADLAPCPRRDLTGELIHETVEERR